MLSHLKNHQLKSAVEGFSCKSANLEVYECQFCYFESDLKIAVCRHESLVHGTTECSDPEIMLRGYICDKCGFETYSLLVFARHVCDDSQLEESFERQCQPDFHGHPRPFKNSFDKTKQKECFKQKTLEKHANISEKKWFECEQCSYKAKNKRRLKSHVLIHLKPDEIKWFECAQCSYKTKRKSDLKKHMLARHSKLNEIKWFECAQCFFKTKENKTLRQHIFTQHSKPSEIKWFQCAQCSYKTKWSGDLKRHILAKHPKPNEIQWFECEKCEFKTKEKGNLKKHILRKHLKSEEIKWFECSQCSYKAKMKSDVKRHMLRSHLDVEKFQ